MSDLINREDAVKAINKALDRETLLYGLVRKIAVDAIRSIPSADRPQGEWIEQEDDYHHYWECSKCGMGVGLDDIRNYCPNCGARMKGADDEVR